MKKVLSFFILMFFICCHFSSAKEKPSKILSNFPQDILGFVSGRSVNYGNPKLGASLGYEDAQGTRITVFIYDLGFAQIEEGVSSAIVEDAKKASVRDIKEFESRGNYVNVKVLLDVDRVFELDSGKSVEAKWIVFSYDMLNPHTREVIPVVSELYVTAMNDHICKVRITRRKDLPEEDLDKLHNVLEVLFATLTD